MSLLGRRASSPTGSGLADPSFASVRVAPLPYASSPSPFPPRPSPALTPPSLPFVIGNRAACGLPAPFPPRFPFLPACISNALALSVFQAAARRSYGAEGGRSRLPNLPPDAPASYGKTLSLRSPGRRRIPAAAACSRSTSRLASSLSPGPWRRGSSRGQLPGSWGPAVVRPAG